MGEPPAGLGATRDELLLLLGAPTDTSAPTQGQRQPMIWRYGDIEYHFGPNDRVWLVYTEDADGTPRVLGGIAEVEPWQSFDLPAHIEAFEAELHRELSPGHCLYGLPLRAIARRPDRDDALFSVEDGSGRVARVHLTWLGREERLPCPTTRIYNDIFEFVADERRADF